MFGMCFFMWWFPDTKKHTPNMCWGHGCVWHDPMGHERKYGLVQRLSFPIFVIYSSIPLFTHPLGFIPFLSLKYRIFPSKDINQHLIVLMKLRNPSAKIRHKIFPCLKNIFPWLKGTFWLKSRKQSSKISSTNLNIHREVDVFDYMPITYYHKW